MTAARILSTYRLAGARIVVGPGCATPTTLLGALVDGAEALAPRARVLSGLLLEDAGLASAVRDGRLRWSTWHPMGPARGLVDDGRVDYLPLRASAVPGFLGRAAPDLAMVRVSPPDRYGYMSLGASVSYPRAAVDAAKVLVGEVDPAVPRTGAASLVHKDRFSALIESESPAPEYESAQVTPEAARTAQNVLEFVPPEAVLQIGIGAVPEQLTSLLGDHGGIRFVGMGSDAMVDLLQSRRPDRGRVLVSAVELMGTDRLMRFADDSPLVEVLPSEMGHSVIHLGRYERLVSVNGAAQIDLAGQVVSEKVAGRHISGVGGSQDFVEAAKASPGGLAIVATTSMAGSRSRIVGTVAPGDPVTIPRHVIDIVVTEHGAADLRGLSERDRAEALIEIAHPAHRASLRQQLD